MREMESLSRVCFYTSPSDLSLMEQQGTLSANEGTLLRGVLAIMKNNISGRTQYKRIIFSITINSLVHKLGFQLLFLLFESKADLKNTVAVGQGSEIELFSLGDFSLNLTSALSLNRRTWLNSCTSWGSSSLICVRMWG